MAYPAKASDAMKKLLLLNGVLWLLLALPGCTGGAKIILPQPKPFVPTQSLAAASDERLAATLDLVIVRDGPGSWAKNVDWDEYLIRIQNLGGDSIRVTNITVLDSLNTRTQIRKNRKELVKGTKQTIRRYKEEGLKVKAGAGLGKMVAGAGAAAVAGSALGAAAVGGATAGGMVAAGAVFFVPALAVGGVMRHRTNTRVNEWIESRQTLLQIVLQEEEEKSLDIFFPLVPSPRQVEITYADSSGEQTLIIDTRTALEGLHLIQPKE